MKRREPLNLKRAVVAAGFWLGMLFVGVQIVKADTIEALDDPAVLHIGTGHGTACAHGCGGDPNLISPTLLSIFVNPDWNGSPVLASLSNPLVLILGVPVFGGPAPSAPVISAVLFYDEDAGGGSAVSFGPIVVPPVGVTADGQLNSGDNGKYHNAYPESGYNNVTNASNNWTNWSGQVPGVSYFDLFAYRLNQSLDGHDLLDVSFGGSGLPLGTIAIAYGCAGPAGDVLDGSCDGGVNDTYSTPFTEAGYVVPEPTSLLLLGTGLLAIGKLGHKYSNRKRPS